MSLGTILFSDILPFNPGSKPGKKVFYDRGNKIRSSLPIGKLALLFLFFGFLGSAQISQADITETKISADDAQEDDNFGYSVFISGDYAIVGAPWEDPGDVDDAGSAYIFHRSGENWTQQAKINAGDAEEGDEFGKSVSISGDYAIVGAPWEDPGDVNLAGSAYIFHRSGENWTQQAKINASDAEEGDYFGYSVSINGDYAIVGADDEDPGDVEHAGSAYIFHRSGENWTQQAKINASDAEERDLFGGSVSISGDYAIVGAYPEDPGGVLNAGSAYIFHRSGENWTQQAKINADDAEREDWFGRSVNISGDYAIVGADREDPEGTRDAGSAYIFHRSGENWTQQAKINASDGLGSDYFGNSVSISGDFAIVGAWSVDLGVHRDAGSAYIFHRFGEDWTQIAKIVASDEEAGDRFGRSVTISGDYAIVGAYYEHPGNVINAGSAYIFTGFEAPFRIPLYLGWNMISSPVPPPDPAMEAVWAEVVGREHLDIAKDQEGRFYVPDIGYNGMDDWDVHQGYLAKLNAPDMLVILGQPVPVDTPIPLTNIWSFVAYFPVEALDARAAFANIEHVLILAKDGSGRFYTPAFDYSNMGLLRRGKGYQVRVSRQVDFVWNVPGQVAAVEVIPTANPKHFTSPTITDRNMSVLLTSGEPTSVGFLANGRRLKSALPNRFCELAAFTEDGLCVGSAVLCSEGPLGMAVWGDDEITPELDGAVEGEPLTFKVWDGQTEREAEIEWLDGDGRYETDGFGVLSFRALVPVEFALAELYPNPFNSATRVTFTLPQSARLSLQVFDLEGRRVVTLVDGSIPAGVHRTVWTPERLASGLYFIRLEAAGRTFTRKALLIR